MKTTTTLALLSLALCCASVAQADTFGSGPNVFDIEFVTIGNPGNAADTTGNPNPAGSVGYGYRIGKFEISEEMIEKANSQSAADGNPLDITKFPRGPNKPATLVTWFEAAQFVNWLNTDSGGSPAYKFNSGGNFQLWDPGDAGYNLNNLYRNSQATYFLPSLDEWYKAAFYNPITQSYGYFTTGTDTAPAAVASGTAADTAVYGQPFATGPADITLAGGLNANGTMGQGGNVWEIEETDSDLVNDSTSSFRVARGGGWTSISDLLSTSHRGGIHPAGDVGNFGFRVASIAIPEPTTAALALALAALCLVMSRRGIAAR